MGNQESSKTDDLEDISTVEPKELLSNGDVTRAFKVLTKRAENGDAIACYDCGFMMVQGIGCKEDLKKGLELMEMGMKLEENPSELSWKSDGSVTELFEPQKMDLRGVFLFCFVSVFILLCFLMENGFVMQEYHYCHQH